MLLELTVRNFAVIEETRLTLTPGFNVITGETGAGKSLLVDALDMVLGGRADRDVIRAGAETASVEAVFQLSPAQSDGQGSRAGLELPVEEDGLLVFAREVHREGRSLCRLNGRTVPVSLVRTAGERLLDIHGQGEHLSLLDPAVQLRFLDGYGGFDALRGTVAEGVARVRRLEQEQSALSGDMRQAEQRRELLAFQVGEIDASRLQPGEEQALQRERELLAGARAIREACESAHQVLHAGSPSAAELIASARQALGRTPDPTGVLAQQVAALEAAYTQVEEAAREVRTFGDSLEDDPGRLEQVEERLELLRRLQRKYGDTNEAVLDFAREARRELELVENTDRRLAELEGELAQARTTAGGDAWELSQARREAVAALEQAVTTELAALSLDGVRFVVALSQEEAGDGLPSLQGTHYAFTEAGIDRVELQVATNPGEGLKSLAKVASGGETSRLMLAIKGALRANDPVPTLVFDEIDSGVGGRTGEVVGRKLWALGRRSQVLCVTHLPQIAAYADHHLRVDKEVLMDRTYAQVVPMDREPRIGELIAMLGSPPGPQVRNVARQMLDRAEAFQLEAARSG